MRPVSLSLPGYQKMKRQQVKDIEVLDLRAEDVVIVEGVVALQLAEVIETDHCFFVDVNETVRRERMLREYAIRGYDRGAALDIYRKRIEDEVPIISQFKSVAELLTFSGDTQAECVGNDYQ
jgi:uridine kinase